MKLCLDCGARAPGTRCKRCEQARQRTRNADPKRRAYKDPSYRSINLVGSRCMCCGTFDDLTRHHLDPLARRLGGNAGAIVAMCRGCNASIGARTMAGPTCPMHGGQGVPDGGVA